jgi:hypothetical protein
MAWLTRPLLRGPHQNASSCSATGAGKLGNHRLLNTLLLEKAPSYVYGGPIVRSLVLSQWKDFGKRATCWDAAFFGLQFGIAVAFQVGTSCLS